MKHAAPVNSERRMSEAASMTSAQRARARHELSAPVRIIATASELLDCGDDNRRLLIAAVATSRGITWLTNHKSARAHLVFEPAFPDELRCPYGDLR
jgi:hypothetical protein